MVAKLIGLLLVCGAPDGEGARLLKTAWASQYEWKEDAVRNATLAYHYSISQRGPGDASSRSEGDGEVVVVEGEIVRRHLRGSTTVRRNELDPHVDWVLGRFIRKPFDEAFKDMVFGAPEATADGATRIPAGMQQFLVKADRLIAEERVMNPNAREPARTRVEFTTEPMRDGYAVVGETLAYGDARFTYSSSRKLTWVAEKEIPVPAQYDFVSEATNSVKTIVTIVFLNPRINLDDPVTLDPTARDLLKAAWEKRYVLPREIRIEGEFTRKADPALGRWNADRVDGTFQIWGLDKIEVALDPKQFRDPQDWAARTLRDDIVKSFRRVMDWFNPRPFEEEFRNCGFVRKGDDVVMVYGYPDALGYRIAAGVIAAHLENTTSDDAWWERKGKVTKEGMLVAKMSRKIEGKLFEQTLVYKRLKGFNIPIKLKLFESSSSSGFPVFGVSEFELEQVKVEMPK